MAKIGGRPNRRHQRDLYNLLANHNNCGNHGRVQSIIGIGHRWRPESSQIDCPLDWDCYCGDTDSDSDSDSNWHWGMEMESLLTDIISEPESNCWLGAGHTHTHNRMVFFQGNKFSRVAVSFLAHPFPAGSFSLLCEAVLRRLVTVDCRLNKHYGRVAGWPASRFLLSRLRNPRTTIYFSWTSSKSSCWK